MSRVLRDADEAATALRNGEVIDWCPGDGTNYTLLLVEHGDLPAPLLIGTSVPMNVSVRMQPEESWVRALPPGCWSGMRPLLHALGVAIGPPEFRQRDANVEAAIRDLFHAQEMVGRARRL